MPHWILGPPCHKAGGWSVSTHHLFSHVRQLDNLPLSIAWTSFLGGVGLIILVPSWMYHLRMGKKMRTYQRWVFLLLPTFNFGTYTFLACYICSTHRASWGWKSTWLSLATMPAQLCSAGHVCCSGGPYHRNYCSRPGWSTYLFSTDEGEFFCSYVKNTLTQSWRGIHYGNSWDRVWW